MIIELGTKKDLEVIVNLTYTQNNILEYSSNYFYKNRDKITKDVSDAIERSEVLVCKKSSEVVGVLLWFSNHTLAVCDCNIFVDHKVVNTSEIMILMINHLKSLYKNKMKMNFFFPRQNNKYVEFLTKMNATKKMNEYQLELTKGNQGNMLFSDSVSVLDKADYDAFAQLHDQIFPDIYINGNDVIKSINKERIVYTIKDKEKIVAFGVLKKTDFDKGTAEIIGVNKPYRRKGYGRTVLSHLITEAFTTHNLTRLSLIVDSDNEGALDLYLDLGFVLKSLNYSFVISN